MKQSTESLKKLLSQKYQVPETAIKRSKKYKSNNLIVREFNVSLEEEEIVCEVTTDEADEEVLGCRTKENNVFSEYYFAIATVQNPDGFYDVSIIRKSFWNKYKHCDDQPCPIEYQLPQYISDLNESSEMAVYLDDWKIAFNDLEKMGMEYNNDLARFLDTHYSNNMYIKP